MIIDINYKNYNIPPSMYSATAEVSGLGNAERLMQDIMAGKVHYDFVEVMACPGGCVGAPLPSRRR